MLRLFFYLKIVFHYGLHSLCLFLLVSLPQTSLAEEMPCKPEAPYEAPKHIPQPQESPASKVRLKDNENGTLTDLNSGLMWTQKDSYADLQQCLNYTDSLKYVERLATGGHRDWRIPTLRELSSIYDETQENVMAWNHNPEYPLALDSKFADGAAYWYWTRDTGASPMLEQCAKTLYFVTGIIEYRRFELCDNGGVRAVRKTP